MRNMAVSICLMASAVIFSGMAGAQEVVNEAARTQAVTGEVVSFDWVADKMAVSWRDFDNNPQQAVFKVPDELKIEKGTEVVSTNDIEVGDTVRIEYSGEFMNEPAIVRMSVVDDQSGE